MHHSMTAFNYSERDSTLPQQLLTFLLAVSITLLPLCWMKLVRVGGATLRPIHIVFALMALILLPQLMSRGIHSINVKSLRTVALLFCVHLAIVGIGLFRPESDSRSYSMFGRLAVYFGFFLLLAELLTRLTPKQLVTATYLGACMGSIIFVLMAVMIFARVGRNLPVEYLTAVAKIDVNRLRCGFYPVLFNYSGGSGQVSKEDALSGSFRHGICASFYCFFFLSMALRPIARSVMGKKWADIIGKSLCYLSLFIMLTSVSRSISIALFSALLIANVLRLLRGRFRLPGPSSLAFLLFLLSALTIAVAFDESVLDLAAEGFRSRYLELGSNARVPMFSEAIQESADQMWFGHGVGAPITQRDQQVHNLVLGSLYEGGVFSMFAAFLFYLGLLVAWLTACIGYVRGELPSDKIDAPWLLGMPMLPLLTPMVSGAAGSFKLNDWVCLAFFFGLMAWFQVASIAPVRFRTPSEMGVPLRGELS